MTPPMFLSVKEAVLTSGLSETEIRRAIYKQEMKAFRKGRKILIPTEELDKWVRSGAIVGTHEDRVAQGRN